jgi:hypothetical protein
MRVRFLHHAADARFVAEVERVMAAHRFEPAGTLAAADVVVVLASRPALREGLGTAPAEALASGVTVVTVLLGEDALPDRFPAPHKHVPLVRDVASALRLLEDHRRTAAAKIAEGKRELFGYGVLLALLDRGPGAAAPGPQEARDASDGPGG